MSVTKNVFRLNKYYDLLLSGCIPAYCAANDPGTLWAWGNNYYGGLGQNNRTQRSSPVQIPGTTWIENPGSRFFTLARKTDGTLWAWGQNNVGQLGQNDIVDRSSPVQIPGTTWCQAKGANFSTVALKTDGTLWGWGQNYYGNIGDGTRTYKSSPVQVPGTTWNDIDGGGGAATFARKTDGTLWAWGFNAGGHLGQNNETPRSSPVQIPGTSWIDLSNGTGMGKDFAFARKSDGTLWAWGQNSYGTLGDNTNTQRSSPIQVAGTSWNDVVLGGSHTLARKTDGTLWAWGGQFNNAIGITGQNDTVQRSSPVQIPGTTWSDIASGQYFALALKTDGTLWTWGCNSGNYVGVLGDNTIIPRSSPVQVPGTSWNDIGGGGCHSLARKFS